MGCGMSSEDKEGKARNEEIESQLKKDKMLQRNEIKMLLLGKRMIVSGIVSTVLTDVQVLENLESQLFSSK